MIFNSEKIVEGIRTRWLFGKDPNGGIIGEYRSSEYEAFKVSTNSRANGNVDLTLTGALGRQLTVNQLSKDKYVIKSDDYKFDRIANKYGLKQFNLDQQQTQELFDMLTLFATEQLIKNVWLV